jgi:glucokinase
MGASVTIGADLGGTKLAVGVVDSRDETLADTEVPSTGYSQEAVIDLLAQEIGRLAGEWPDAVAAGVGIPATIDFDRGYAISTVNLGLEEMPVRDLLTERLGMPVVIDNDANLALLAEAEIGAARGTRNALMLTLGTGVGGALWLNGALYRGSAGAGAELGHMVVEFDGPKCQGNCPGRGCLEVFASGTGIGRMGREEADRVPDSELGRRAAAGEEIDARVVGQAAREGDPAALAAIDRAGRYLGTGLVSYANIFQPEVIVIGGGAMALGDLLLDPAREEVRSRALRPMCDTPVVMAELGPAAGMIGAAILARNETGKLL